LRPPGSNLAPSLHQKLRSENRATLVALIARAGIGLTNSSATERGYGNDCETRVLHHPQGEYAMSLAFLAPDLVKAAIEGTLPHGMVGTAQDARASLAISVISNPVSTNQVSGFRETQTSAAETNRRRTP
jgi:hypothetical protein